MASTGFAVVLPAGNTTFEERETFVPMLCLFLSCTVWDVTISGLLNYTKSISLGMSAISVVLNGLPVKTLPAEMR